MIHQKNILVVGGGISGITAAVELAEAGHKVTLIEKKHYLGGRVAQFSNYFPKLCPPQCGLEINFQRIRKNSRIKVLTNTEIENFNLSDNIYIVRLKKNAGYINDSCTACGKCADVCPIERTDDFNFNLKKTKSAFLPYSSVFPYKYVIDETCCKQHDCALCLNVCDYNAINFDTTTQILTEEFDSIVIATGWQPYDASIIENLNYGNHPDILTNVEFERLLSPDGPTGGKLIKPSDNTKPKTIVFVQCAGSRDVNYLSYCSAVCCTASVKHALLATEHIIDVKITVFYIDLRIYGRNEDLLVKAKQNDKISFIKGKAGKVNIQHDNTLIVEFEDVLRGNKTNIEADMVVLATGIVPSFVFPEIKTDSEGFIDETKLSSGIFATGCSVRPLDVSATVKTATKAALNAIQKITN